jgi:hypothetical protein
MEALGPGARQKRVSDVRVGLGYSAVRLEDGNVGTAMTFQKDGLFGCSVFSGMRPLAGRNAMDLLELIGGQNSVESSVGLACANALANRPREDLREGDVLEHLELRAEDRVGMVGCFGPLIEPIRSRAGSLVIYERIPEPREGLRPTHEVSTGLPECTVAVVTATSLANNTIDEVLESAGACRRVVVLGASTPLCPEAFAHTPVSMLSGVVVTDPEGLLRVVSEGGGMRHFKGLIKKVNIEL